MKISLYLIFFTVSLNAQNYYYSIGESKNEILSNSSSKYTLLQTSRTSAGVFSRDSILLRTLWSNRDQKANTYSVPKWDGLNDLGENVIDDAGYIKVISNNIQVEWEGVIGNTSDSFNGENIHRNWDKYHDGLYYNGKLYFISDWTEAWGSIVEVDTNNINYKTELMPNKTSQPYPNRIAISGDTIYFAGRSALTDASISFVQAAKITELGKFSNQLDFQGKSVDIYGKTFKVTDLVESDLQPRVTGLAVQQDGDWLIVAREKINSVHVVNKKTGITIQNLTYNFPKHCKFDKNGNLWMVHDEILEKFSVDESTGALTASGFNISGFTNVAALDISPDGSTIAVADAAINQQVKGYNTATGALLWTLGRSESYLTDATVYNDKFLFISPEPSVYESKLGYSGSDRYSFLIYYPDGSLMVGDRDNNRYIKFDVNRNYQDEFMFLRATYACNVDKVNPSRVFAGFQEFNVDYKLDLLPDNSNNAWKLIANWGGGADYKKEKNSISILDGVCTLFNNRTYAISKYDNIVEIIELVKDGTIRYTGVKMFTNGYDKFELKSNGKITFISGTGKSDVVRLFEREILGFDTNNNPILGEIIEIANYNAINNVRFSGATVTSGEITDNGNFVLFNGWGGGKFHLGGIKRGSSILSFKTAKSIIPNLEDSFPENGEFDDRGPDSYVYKGSTALALDRFIIWGYHGEFWRNSQVNKWNMVTENGLFLTQFGATGLDSSSHGEIFPKMAGNAFSPSLVKVNNVFYLWHNDEGYHGGLHRWKISNLESVNEYYLKIN
ncbi:YncE family protein [Maribacter dokdonensis]|uniref:YncE family protein n=1 Tax=Maribacter dokdonensis TaxID=320912 RepID=UPI002AAFD389|nr:hypothetical protein [Maribacter dokdonensis]